MKNPFDVVVVVGSLRKEALSRKTALALVKLAPPSLKLEISEIGDLPLYNQDVDDAGAPQSWQTFRERIRNADALLFVTPEYNRTIPAPLKNAIDVGSRPYGKSAWGKKPGGVVSISPGAMGGFGANHHLRQSLVFLDVFAMQQPEAYLGGVGNWFDELGNLINESAQSFLKNYIDAFAQWVRPI